MTLAPLASLFVVGAQIPLWAHLAAARRARVTYGHHHLNATSLAAHRAFWVDALGGSPVTVGGSAADVLAFPNVLVFVTPNAPSGGTIGSTVNHVCFETPDIRAAVDRLKTSGFEMITRSQLPPVYVVEDDLARAPNGDIGAFVRGPDELKVELIENRAASRLGMHHVHFAAPDVAAMKAWYVDTFGARPGTRAGFEAADLPGVNLTFSGSSEPVAPTRGRALDHIGFEIRDLEAFCRDLEARSVAFDRAYAPAPSGGIAAAALTDPWGTSIELTEGLGAV